MLISPQFTAFYHRAGQGYKLVIVIAGRLQQAVHACGDDRGPLVGLFLLNSEAQLKYVQKS